MSAIVHRCAACGRAHTFDEWRALEFVGLMHTEPGCTLWLVNCQCGGTMPKLMLPAPLEIVEALEWKDRRVSTVVRLAPPATERTLRAMARDSSARYLDAKARGYAIAAEIALADMRHFDALADDARCRADRLAMQIEKRKRGHAAITKLVAVVRDGIEKEA